MTARIYRPAKSATQSGQADLEWRLDFEPESAPTADPLTGWTSSSDMRQQIRLAFATKDDAIAYAQRNGLTYRVEEPKPVLRPVVSYSDNFKMSRAAPWTH
ncbi:ETC complex I subunit [Methylovirgula sp. 4M-Z18]|uniref:ETC complex I subunit n=1 Tax=Methylovirgula sp. 4M-Z18 TaxID=2293567 RepID=UPI000E2EEA39|nr:ETC complex I subunit [Methylovirgula sp. 4M-Z18]RFB80247.1 ETC complex I subunit [Methylovirgula sp. 4M-Z18]